MFVKSNEAPFTVNRCAVEMSTRIDDEAIGFVGVTMNTFRFVELGNRVSRLISLNII